MMHEGKIGLLIGLGLAMACGGSEFTSDTGATGGASTTAASGTSSGSSSVVTSAATGTTTSGTTSSSSASAGGATSGSSGPGSGSSSSSTSGGGSGGAGNGGAAGSGGAPGRAGSAGSGGASGGASGSGGHGGSGGSGGTGGARDAGTDASPVDCNALRMDLDQKLAAAQKCDPKATVAECQDMVEGVCCKAPVRSSMSPETAAYLDAFAKFQNNHCIGVCTQALCPVGTGTCMPDPDGAGKCTFGLMPTGP